MSADEMDNENVLNQDDDNGGDDGGDENYEEENGGGEPSAYEILQSMMNVYTKYENISTNNIYTYIHLNLYSWKGIQQLYNRWALFHRLREESLWRPFVANTTNLHLLSDLTYQVCTDKNDQDSCT